MTIEEAIFVSAFNLVSRHDAHLVNDGSTVQAARVQQRLARLHQITPLSIPLDIMINLAGFGEVRARFQNAEGFFVLLSEAAESLGFPLPQAYRWAREEWLDSLEAQREADEARGDERIGWECLTSVWDLHLCLCIPDPEAKPDAAGQRWSPAGDFLVAADRLPALILASPWGREFSANLKEWSGLAALHAFGDHLRDVLVVSQDGQVGNLLDALTSRIDMNDEQALRKAQRGPVIPDEADEDD